MIKLFDMFEEDIKQWSLDTFKLSNKYLQLNKLILEKQELERAETKENCLEELADMYICYYGILARTYDRQDVIVEQAKALIESAELTLNWKYGDVGEGQIATAISKKFNINKSRTWTYNEKTKEYRHI